MRADGPQLVVLDVDGTLTPHRSVWRYIHEQMGLWTEHADRYLEQYCSGEIDYDEFCARDARLWKGVPSSRVESMVRSLPYNPGVSNGLRRLAEAGLPVALLSTGLTLLVDRIRAEFGLRWSLANELASAGGVLTGHAVVNVRDGEKGAALAQLSRETGIEPIRMAAVGDSANDVDVARRVGWFVAYRCTSVDLAEAADHVCESEDFGEAVDRVLSWRAPSQGRIAQ